MFYLCKDSYRIFMRIFPLFRSNRSCITFRFFLEKRKNNYRYSTCRGKRLLFAENVCVFYAEKKLFSDRQYLRFRWITVFSRFMSGNNNAFGALKVTNFITFHCRFLKRRLFCHRHYSARYVPPWLMFIDSIIFYSACYHCLFTISIILELN